MATVGIAVWLMCSAAAAGLPSRELLQHLPPGVNAIAVIDVETLLKSDVAQREKWKSKRDVNYGSRPLMVPPEARTVLVAAQLNPANDLKQEWQVSLVDMAERFSLDHIAKTEGGYIDPVGDLQAVWTPSDAYVIEFQPRMLAMAQPANRQAISRWTKFAQTNKEIVLSDYLNDAMTRLTNDSQFVLAVDLADVPQRHRVDESLADLEMFSGRDMKRQKVAELLVGLRGVTVTVSVTDRIMGELRVDFRDDAGPLEGLEKELTLKILDRFDAHLSDLDGFDAVLNGKSLTLSGALSLDGLRRVGSLMQMGTTKFSDLEDVEPAAEGSSDIVNASKAYFTSVTTLIDDLEKTLMDKRDNHALWMERYGKKIDALPILNVDKELLAWGANVGSTFREMGLAKRGAGIRGGVRKSSVYGGYRYSGYNAYGGRYYAGYRSSFSQRNQIKRQEDARAQEIRFSSWKEIQDTRAQMRIDMTEKYAIEF